MVLILAIAAVWTHRKKRDAENEDKIDAAEHEETLEPLQENNDEDEVGDIFGIYIHEDNNIKNIYIYFSRLPFSLINI